MNPLKKLNEDIDELAKIKKEKIDPKLDAKLQGAAKGVKKKMRVLKKEKDAVAGAGKRLLDASWGWAK